MIAHRVHCSMFKGRSGACRRKSREEEGVCAKMDLAVGSQKKSWERAWATFSRERGAKSWGGGGTTLLSFSLLSSLPCKSKNFPSPPFARRKRRERLHRHSSFSFPPLLRLEDIWGEVERRRRGKEKLAPPCCSPLLPPPLLPPVGVPAAEASFGGSKVSLLPPFFGYLDLTRLCPLPLLFFLGKKPFKEKRLAVLNMTKRCRSWVEAGPGALSLRRAFSCGGTERILTTWG